MMMTMINDDASADMTVVMNMRDDNDDTVSAAVVVVFGFIGVCPVCMQQSKSDQTDIDAVSNIAHTHVTPVCDLLHKRQAGWPTPPVLKRSCGIQSFVKTCQNIPDHYNSQKFSVSMCFNCDSHVSHIQIIHLFS